MDLGVMKFRCQGANALLGALHEDNGLVWTDGRGIYLTPVTLYQGNVQNEEQNKLGEFDRGVVSVHWSDNVSAGLCYMCVVHEKNISIWKVEGHQPKLAFKQVRKVNIQPIPQGCLWNPRRDILCVLCPQQGSLYYSHVQNKGSQVLLQLERDKIRCGCWLSDGSRLVICIGTTLMVYHWSDIDNSVTQYTVSPWTVPGLVGRISAVAPVSHNRVLYTAELPLESLCKQQDTFLLPDLLNTNSNGRITDSLTDSDIIAPKKELSVTETLFNIPRNPETVLEDWSRLDCVELREEADPLRVCGINIQGVLTPDILLYDPGQFVVVGSNTQSLLQVYSLNKSGLNKSSEISLTKDERPKGIASLPKSCHHDNQGVLLLVGKTERTDATFPSATNTTKMKSVLKLLNVKHVKIGKNPLAQTQSVPAIPASLDGNESDHDYEVITHSVLNFDTNLRNLNNKENGHVSNAMRKSKELEKPSEDMSKPNLAQSESGNVQTTALKQNGEQSSTVSEDDSTRPVPPKRPVRKKRSMTGREALSAKSSASSENLQEGVSSTKMAMEYLSDSPEMSPRDNSEHQSKVKDVCETGNQKQDQSGVRTDVTSSDVKSYSKLNDQSKSEDKLPNGSVHKENGELETIKISTNPELQSSVPNRVVELGDKKDSEKDLEVETVEFKSQEQNFASLDFSNLYTEEEKGSRVVQELLTRKLKKQEVPSGMKPSVSLESLDDIDRILKEQNLKIAQLQEQMTQLSKRVDASTCVLPSRYMAASKPDVVQICFRCKDGVEIKKGFLLDNGRVQLEQVKQAFSLDTVEIFIDDEPCVTGCNIDGYIPVRFDSGSTVYISGKPALT